MHDAEQGLSRRVEARSSNRRPVLSTWKIWLPATALIAIALLLPFPDNSSVEPATLTWTELTRVIDGGRVSSLSIETGEAIFGNWKTSASEQPDFVTVYPLEQIESLLERASAAGIEISFADPSTSGGYRFWGGIAIQATLLIGLALLVYMGLRTQGVFGQSVGEKAGRATTSFADVAGTQGAADELRELVTFLKEPATFAALGARVPKGMLLVGPPGTGKTLLARAVAGEAGVPFFFLSGSEVTGFIVGMGAQRIRTLFKRARKEGGVIFIDELDALGGIRGRNKSHNEDDRTLNQLLVEMDGFSPSDGVVVIAATNRPEELDNALRRPGRFDRTVTVALPTVDGREAILRLHATNRRVPLGADVDLRRLARLTPGSSGAELAGLLNEAAIAAVRERSREVSWQHFEIARDRMLLGKERVGFRANDTEWQTVAWHEAGHALAGVVACPEDGLHKVTIQPRGQAMGVAYFSPDDDRHLHSKRYLEGQIIKGLGGRVAEEIAFGVDNITGGAESDLVQVNRIARRMVYRLGMGEQTGLVIYDDQSAPLSGEMQSRMDAEVRAMLDRLYARTHEILTAHRDALDALAQALLERETIEGEEAMVILAAHGVEVRSELLVAAG